MSNDQVEGKVVSVEDVEPSEDDQVLNVFVHSTSGLPDAWTEDEVECLLVAWRGVLESQQSGPPLKLYDASRRVAGRLLREEEGGGLARIRAHKDRRVAREEVREVMKALRNEYTVFKGMRTIPGLRSHRAPCVDHLEHIFDLIPQSRRAAHLEAPPHQQKYARRRRAVSEGAAQATKTEQLQQRKDDGDEESGRVPLHWAASGSQKNIVNLLLQHGSPVDEPDDSNWTPLMIASSAGCQDIVEVLIERGANVNAINQTGQSALHYAASKNREQIVRVLLSHHANVNACDHMGSTPLHRAASKGNLKVVRIFLQEYSNQLNLSPRDCVGNTPLHLACEEERMEAAKLLIEAGANTDALNKEKRSIFDMAPPQLRPQLHKMVEEAQQP